MKPSFPLWQVIYGDTDSIMIYSGLDDIVKATAIARKVAQEVRIWLCTSHLLELIKYSSNLAVIRMSKQQLPYRERFLLKFKLWKLL